MLKIRVLVGRQGFSWYVHVRPSCSLSEDATQGNGEEARAGIVIEKGCIEPEQEELTKKDVASCRIRPSSRPARARVRARRTSKDREIEQPNTRLKE